MSRVVKLYFWLACFGVLAGCAGTAEPVWAPEVEVSRAAYRHDGPATLTLFTVINNNTGSGAHSSLMVNGSQRVIFDPAGTWHHPRLPERNDVHFGMTDAAVEFYVDYHSRVTYRTVIQEVVVSEAVAEAAMKEILAYGAVPKALCSISVSTILGRLPGFESIERVWFPKKISEAFAKIPGVKTDVVYDNDPDDNSGVIVARGI